MENTKNKLIRNLKLIRIDDYDDKIILTGLEKTKIKSNLKINKYNSKKNSNNKKSDLFLKSYLYSVFIGGIFINDIYYIILAKKVKILKFGKIEIYEIISVDLCNFHNEWKINEILSKKFSSYFNKGFYFSFDIDLTYSQNYVMAFKNIIDSNEILKLNFFFFANRFMIDDYFEKSEWVIPLIHGKINIKEFKIKNEFVKLYFIFKKSIFSINEEYKKDVSLFQDFVCPDEFDTIDVFREENGSVTAFEIVINDYFGKFNIFLENKFENYFDFRINYQHIKKHFDFMSNIMNINFFIFQNGYKNKKIIQLINDYWMKNKNTNNKIKNIKITKNRKFIKILKNIQIIYDQFKKEEKEENKISKLVLNICGSQINTNLSEILFFLYNKLNYTKKEINPEIENFEIDQIKNFINEIKKSKDKNILKEIILESEIEINQILYGLKKSTSNSLRKKLNKKSNIFNYKNILISFITHNCGGLPEEENLIEKIKYKNIEEIKNSNLLIIGLQEILEMKSKNFTNILFNDNESFLKKWIFALENCFGNFNLIGHVSMLGLVFVFFQHKNSFENFFVQPFKKKLFKFGFMSFADKGAIFVGLRINFEKIGLINCHLQSGNSESGFNERKQSFKILIDYLISKKNINLKFVLGDLNFRNKSSAENLNKLLIEYKSLKDLSKKDKLLEKIKKYDEFYKIKKNSLIIKDFLENEIDFLPSYKWIKNSNVYNYKEGTRIPSWTDRIIYKNDYSTNFASILYQMDYKTSFSDHK